MKLLQIRLLVNDFKKSVEFYKDSLGLPISWLEKEMEYALFDNGETKIELLSRENMAEIVGEERKSLDGDAQSRFLLQSKVEDVDKTYDYLHKQGIKCVNEPHDRQEWRARVAHFRDPDNNLIEIYKMI
ncbi:MULTISPECIES: VOC family protein [Bacillus]|uniref:VOC family protein n=1 Tax=Bacillus TaxID=1386 RepID=UPI0010A3BC7C|nr:MULTISPECIES: VOC family protein [Bacillus amyloliquefaciens group]MBO3649910.1 VOC family protein [Bacillus amyloliquefaciens]MCJ2175634.1 VOC family protein [Bacillus amyloliquefaciens]MCR4351665.1 VOC family protein [Bacillus amyloliquefaciens]MCR4358165.1 VOC family protein [Bacillus amyloliquefaciens]MCR4366580.1 VOC family protein [Bacillus amyloliquefaciens]